MLRTGLIERIGTIGIDGEDREDKEFKELRERLSLNSLNSLNSLIYHLNQRTVSCQKGAECYTRQKCHRWVVLGVRPIGGIFC